MNILTIWEDDGQTTRIVIPIDAIAIEMAGYFKNELGLATLLESQYPYPIKLDEEETERANLYVNEWRNFGGKKLSIVK